MCSKKLLHSPLILFYLRYGFDKYDAKKIKNYVDKLHIINRIYIIYYIYKIRIKKTPIITKIQRGRDATHFRTFDFVGRCQAHQQRWKKELVNNVQRNDALYIA